MPVGKPPSAFTDHVAVRFGEHGHHDGEEFSFSGRAEGSRECSGEKAEASSVALESVGDGEHFLHLPSVTVQFRTHKVSVGRKSSHASTSPEQGGLCKIEHRRLVQYSTGNGEFSYHLFVPAPSSQLADRDPACWHVVFCQREVTVILARTREAIYPCSR